jgi:hypothetical protein
MGMLPSYLRLVASMHGRYAFQGPVCSLGNQDIWASYAELKRCFLDVNCSYQEPSRLIPHSSRTFAMDGQLSGIARDFVHARVFFEMLGISDYVDLDKFDSDRPAVLHDLNQPVPEDLQNRFGLVFDGGTIEHIFDVRQVMDNVRHLLRVRGCVIHVASFRMDHGFYAFSPGFFYDFYGANGFGEFECHLLEVDFSNIASTYARRHRCVEYQYGMPLDGLLDASKEILVFFAARKLESTPALSIPTQGTYERRSQAPMPQAALSLFQRTVPGWLQPVVAPARPLARAAYRALQRLRARRDQRIGEI